MQRTVAYAAVTDLGAGATAAEADVLLPSNTPGDLVDVVRQFSDVPDHGQVYVQMPRPDGTGTRWMHTDRIQSPLPDGVLQIRVLLGPAQMETPTKRDLEKMRDELREELQDLKLIKPGSATTSTYAELYELSKQRSKRQKTTFTSRWAWGNPPESVPEELGRAYAGGEDAVLLPKLMSVLSKLPGARELKLRVGRQEHTVVQLGDLQFIDTHSYRWLSNLAPDITLIRAGYGIDAFNALSVIELQCPPLDNAYRGKMVKYLTLLMEANPYRPFAVGMLTDLVQVTFFMAERDRGHVDVFDDGPFDLQPEANPLVGWGKISHFCTGRVNFGRNLPELLVDQQQLRIIGFLGSGSGVFAWRAQYDGKEVVCKLYTNHIRQESFELEHTALKIIQEAGQHAVFPRLLHTGQSFFLTEPVVTSSGDFSEVMLIELLDGFDWLHNTAKLAHRDVEPRHIGIARGDVRIIDLSAALPLDEESQGYTGTIVYASNDVLDALAADTAVPALVQQDLVALVKSLYVLLHGSARTAADQLARKLRGHTKATTAAMVYAFWETELSNTTTAGKAWRALVETAHVNQRNADYATTKEQLRTGLGAMLRAWK